MKKILWIATKSPLPPRDGGRLVMLEAIRALSQAGWRISVLFPAEQGVRLTDSGVSEDPGFDCRLLPVKCAPRTIAAAAAMSLIHRTPLTIARHSLPAMRRRVALELERERYNVVVCEQLHALSSIGARAQAEDRPRLVLRAQNVESDLWHSAARLSKKFWLSWQAARMEVWEGRAILRCDRTHALTAADGHRLQQLAGAGARVTVVAPAFPPRLSPGPPLSAGDPALILFGSAGWFPNRDGASWFVENVWPEIRGRHPRAVLHVFGDQGRFESDGISYHPRPLESSRAFAENGILVVPLRLGSGLRIKVLEAWARRVPVLATKEAAAGLKGDGSELRLFSDGSSAANAIEELQCAERRRELVAAGARRLESSYSYQRFAQTWDRQLAVADDRHRQGMI